MLDHLKPDCMLEFRKKHMIKQSSFKCKNLLLQRNPYFITPTVGWSTNFDKILNL